MGNLLNVAMKAIEPNHITPHSYDRKEMKIIKDVKPQDRQDSLSDRMEAIVLDARDRVIKLRSGKQTILTDEIIAVEGEIERLQHDVLNGKANLADFQAACDRWVASHSK